jgi:hypothetical protein
VLFSLRSKVFKHVQQYNCLIDFNSCPEFRQSFNLCQASAILPPHDVTVGFEIVKSKAPTSFKRMFGYIERT